VLLLRHDNFLCCIYESDITKGRFNILLEVTRLLLFLTHIYDTSLLKSLPANEGCYKFLKEAFPVSCSSKYIWVLSWFEDNICVP
jgi:hypothetical protein